MDEIVGCAQKQLGRGAHNWPVRGKQQPQNRQQHTLIAFSENAYHPDGILQKYPNEKYNMME